MAQRQAMVPIPIRDLNLRDTETIHSIAQARKYSPCPHSKGISHHECSGCLRDQIKTLMTPSFLFAICANQFLLKAIPPEIQIVDQGRREFNTVSDARKYINCPDEQLEAILKAGKLITIQLRTGVKRVVPVDAKMVEAAITTVQAACPTLLDDMMVKSQAGPDVEKLDHEEVFVKINERFRADKNLYFALAKQCSIPLEVMTDIVLPRVLGAQANTYLKTYRKGFVERFPPLKDLFDSAKHVLRKLSGSDFHLKFVDPTFPTYDANRVGGLKSNLSVMAGPNNSQQVVHMFQNTVFNPKYRVDEVVLVADYLKGRSGRGDLANYFHYPQGTTKIFTLDDAKDNDAKDEKKEATQKDPFSTFEVTVLETDDEALRLRRHMGDTSWRPDETRSATIKLQVKQLGSGDTRILTVHFFKMRSGGALDLTHVDDFERFYEMYKRAQKHPVGVQSGRSSVGRPSVVIFAFELARFFKENQNNINNINISESVRWVLRNIRSHNPAFVNSESDYIEGVKLACALSSHERTLKDSLERLSIVSSDSSSSSNINSSINSGSAGLVESRAKALRLAIQTELGGSSAYSGAPLTTVESKPTPRTSTGELSSHTQLTPPSTPRPGSQVPAKGSFFSPHGADHGSGPPPSIAVKTGGSKEFGATVRFMSPASPAPLDYTATIIEGYTDRERSTVAPTGRL